MARWQNTTPAPTAPDTSARATLKWQVEFITPMFGGGVQTKVADPKTPVRASSVRGQLRFWWRAAIGSRMGSIEAMREREAELFGAPTRRATVELAIEGQPQPIAIDVPAALRYGAFALLNDTPPGRLFRLTGPFTVKLTCRPQDRAEVERTVETWLAFGGLGGRTRRGFGALKGGKWSLNRITNEAELPQMPSLCDHQPGQGWTALPQLPSLCGHRLSQQTPAVNTPKSAHELLIKKLRDFRQGVDGRNPGKERPGRSRWPEPDEIRRRTHHAHTDHAPVHPARAFPRGLFGMPIIFKFTGYGEPPKMELVPKDRTRLASPLILRPYQAPDDGPIFSLALVLNYGELSHLEASLNQVKDQQERRPERLGPYSVSIALDDSALTPDICKANRDWTEHGTNCPLRKTGLPHIDPLEAFLDYFAKLK